jgi:hypothetical protein
VADVYALPFSWPAVLAAAVGLSMFLGRGRPRRGWVVPAVAAVLGIAFLTGAAPARYPAQALRLGAEEVAFALVPLTLWGSLAALRRGVGLPTATVSVGALTALQLYPRVDFEHLAQVAPILVPLALRLWADGVRGALPARMAPALLAALPLVVAAGRFAPTARVLGHVASGAVETVSVGENALSIEPAGAEGLRALAAAAEVVRAHSRPEDPVFQFPACAAVLFFAGRLPAGPHDYFYPGRPDRTEAAALVARLAADPPRLAVTCSGAGSELARAWDYYPEVKSFLDTRYRVLLERSPFVVLSRSAPD